MTPIVLIHDPDPDFARALAEQLEDGGLGAELVASADDAAARLRQGTAAALVIAAQLPEVDALGLCRGLRDDGVMLPIILLAASPEFHTRGIDAGADDVFLRPIRLGALIGRLRQVWEQARAGADEAITIGPYQFEIAGKRLVQGKGADALTIHLTEKETGILWHLARAGGIPVPREQLLREVWRYNPEVTTHTLETHVYRLRQKMETASAPGPFVVTDGGGYRLVGIVAGNTQYQ